jgi:hypothetical protein
VLDQCEAPRFQSAFGLISTLCYGQRSSPLKNVRFSDCKIPLKQVEVTVLFITRCGKASQTHMTERAGRMREGSVWLERVAVRLMARSLSRKPHEDATPKKQTARDIQLVETKLINSALWNGITTDSTL